MFEEMVRNIQEDAVKVILNTRVDKNRVPERQRVAQPISASHGDQGRQPVVRSSKKVGRNENCPCGSGKKYKKCCGMN